MASGSLVANALMYLRPIRENIGGRAAPGNQQVRRSKMAVRGAREGERPAFGIEEAGALAFLDAADLRCRDTGGRRGGAERGDLVGRHGAQDLVVVAAG